MKKGKNTLGAILGNGWYNQRDRTVEGCMWYNTPRMLLQLEIEYTDGTKDQMITDDTWKCTTGPLLHDAIFTGEVYDARKELGLWNKNNYNDSVWQPAIIVSAPTGKLQPQLAPFDKIRYALKPQFKGRINDSTYLYKLPKMLAGWAELNVKGKAGSKIKLRFIGEEEQDFGQFDNYILKGVGKEQWEPRFTWHTFRYIELITHDVDINEESLMIKAVNTDPALVGHFECSNSLFCKINEAYLQTQQANFHGSISSDCPHRERVAYTGDGQLIIESSIYSFDMTQFYRKWFDDIDDARNKITGYVPHTAPFAGGGGGPAWGSAYVVTPAFVFFSGGWTLLVLSLCFWLIDVKKKTKLVFPFAVIGMNSMLIYLLTQTVGPQWLNGFVGIFSAGFLELAGLPAPIPAVFAALCVLFLEWWLCYFFYKKSIFLKI